MITRQTDPGPGSASPSPPRLRRAGRAARVLFAALGLMAGAWGAHVPSVKAAYGLDEGLLALALFALAAGAVASLFVAGRLIGRLGTRRASLGTGVLMALLLASALLWPSLPVLLAALAVLGMAMSVHDVAINAEGTALERLGGQPLMGQLHAMFSVGAMAGALGAGAMLRLAWPPALQLALVGGVLALVIGVACAGMLDAHPAALAGAGERRFVWPRGPLLLIGLLILAGLLAEGAMYDWSVLYLQQARGLPQDVAALGYAAFAGAMAVGRFACDRLRARFGDRALLAGGAWLGTAALALALSSPHPAACVVGFAFAGLGLAPVVPLLYTAASRAPGSTSAAAIAAASSIGYSGMVIGPPLIGAIAEVSSLGAALWVVVAAIALLALGASRLGKEQAPD
jgi:predicted MFS family arabinose efflux permease